MSMVNMVIKDTQTFTIVEDAGFRKLMCRIPLTFSLIGKCVCVQNFILT